MKNKILILTTLFGILLLGMSACSESSVDVTNDSKSKPNNTAENKEGVNSSKDATVESDSNNKLEEASMASNDSDDKEDMEANSNTAVEESTDSSNNEQENDAMQQRSTPEKMDKKREVVLDTIHKELMAFPNKMEGSKKELLERLDNLQKELDSLPDKEFSDTGTTNAMKNYYGISDEKYDIALNKIYDLLKKELPSESMKRLKTEQIQWIEKKGAKAERERQKYAGKTNEWVAYYISSYESTKERCYELVNEYIVD